MVSLRERLYLILGDFGLTWLGLVLALLLRTEFDWAVTLRYLENETWFLLSFSSTLVLLLWLRGIYSRNWRYTGIGDGVDLLVTLTLVLIPFQLIAMTARGLAFPRTGLLLAFLPILFLLSTFRLGFRRASELRRRRQDGLSYFVVGYNDAAEVAVRELSRSGGRAIGLIALRTVSGRPSLRGCPYLGGLEQLPELVETRRPDGLILAGLSPAENRQVMELSEGLGLKLRLIPPISELLGGSLELQSLRPLALEDLLEREPVRIDPEQVGRYLSGRSVLVTGAGGSIGSEIVRQVLPYEPARIVLFGRGENSIHEILTEIKGAAKGSSGAELIPFIGDVKDGLAVRRAFELYAPTVIFHAAAHKHVPLMEDRPVEACQNNILGTLNLIEAARDRGVERFIALSTDKAVDPSSVMGATKRVMELLISTYGGDGFASVRFGNVLGSRGSVVPTLQKQIASGGPVTVTSEEMERYFMTIPEAVALVLGAGELAQRGETFVLEMGHPVKIVTLAENLIRLSGYTPHKDVQISFTGARPGERLSERLTSEGETTEPSDCPGILRIRASDSVEGWPGNLLDELRLAVGAGDEKRCRSLLFQLVEAGRPVG